MLAVAAGAAGIGMKSTEQSPPGIMIPLNLNSGAQARQSEVGRFDQFQKNSKVAALKVLTLQKSLHLWIKICKPLSSMARGSILELWSGILFQLNKLDWLLFPSIKASTFCTWPQLILIDATEHGECSDTRNNCPHFHILCNFHLGHTKN